LTYSNIISLEKNYLSNNSISLPFNLEFLFRNIFLLIWTVNRFYVQVFKKLKEFGYLELVKVWNNITGKFKNKNRVGFENGHGLIF
jgi:hypothetical protein